MPATMKNKRRRVLFKASEDSSDSEDDDKQTEYIQLHGNKILFYCDVNKKTAMKLIQKISEASKYAIESAAIGEDPVVYVYIHSDGGCAYVGLSLFDHIKASKVKIVTIADGFVASSASLLLLAGHERWGMANSNVLIHQIRSGFWGKFDELLDEITNSKMLMNDLTSIYRTRTTMRPSKLNDLLKKELNMNSTQCLEYGFISKIIGK